MRSSREGTSDYLSPSPYDVVVESSAAATAVLSANVPSPPSHHPAILYDRLHDTDYAGLHGDSDQPDSPRSEASSASSSSSVASSGGGSSGGSGSSYITAEAAVSDGYAVDTFFITDGRSRRKALGNPRGGVGEEAVSQKLRPGTKP
ncbi:hypothetical protein CRUP_030282 [Coryphaenoides rupestris]|nr:hypothetical protein CRUP_030282 [Coryphaenoides rupestris]